MKEDDTPIDIFYGMTFCVPFVALGIILTSLLSNTVESYSPAILVFCNVMETIVPAIKGFTSVSSNPMVTKMFLSIGSALFPFLSVGFFFKAEVTPTPRALELPRWKLIIVLVVLAAVGFVLPAITQPSPESLTGGMRHEWALRMVSTSRVWLGIIGSMMFLSFAYMAALTASYIRAMVLGNSVVGSGKRLRKSGRGTE